MNIGIDWKTRLGGKRSPMSVDVGAGQWAECGPRLQPKQPKRLPNQATITFVVRDAAQLRQMKNYQLDSLTSRLAGYIARADGWLDAGGQKSP